MKHTEFVAPRVMEHPELKAAFLLVIPPFSAECFEAVNFGFEVVCLQVKVHAFFRSFFVVGPLQEDSYLGIRQAQAAIDAATVLFTTRTGQPVEPRDLGRSFERITQHAGLRPIRLHDLRNTVAQFLKRLRTAPNDAKEILGHARITTTLAIYTSGDEDDQRSALDKISDLLFQPPAGQ